METHTDAQSQPAALQRVHAAELVNSTPPFSVAGGVRDILTHSAGDVLVADRASAVSAAAMFEELEGVDLVPGAAVAVACLRDVASSGRIPPDARVLLNVTGGGRRRVGQARDRARSRMDVRMVDVDSAPEAIAPAILGSLSSGARGVR